MKPILYSESERAFQTNGIGILSDAIYCIVKAELNGKYELTLQYPANGIHREAIAQRNIILAKADPVSRLQPFRIYKIHKPMHNTITVNARHVAYDLAGIDVMPFSAASAPVAMEGLSANSITSCPFTFRTDKLSTGEFSVKVPSAIWSLLGGSDGSVLDVFGGEYEYDRWNVFLHSCRGADRGVSIRYGKNLTSLEQDENCANCYTGVIPYWVDKKSGKCVMLPEKVVWAAGNFGYVKTLPLDLSGDFDAAPSPAEMTAAAREYMESNAICEPVVGWKVEFVSLEQTAEYKGKAILERVLLGDTVHVDFADMAILASARATATEYDSILERYNNITLGSIQANIADTIANQGKTVAAIPSATQLTQAMRQVAGASVGAVGGAIRLVDTDGDGMPDTLYITDSADPAQALLVRRLNHEGWAVSKTGYNGPYELLEDGAGAMLKLYAKDLDSGNIVGHSVGWKTIDGVPYLVGAAG
mgnify:CR=1 FL=1